VGGVGPSCSTQEAAIKRDLSQLLDESSEKTVAVDLVIESSKKISYSVLFVPRRKLNPKLP
jgi:hypothetical protein